MIKELFDNDAIRPFNTNDNNVFAYAFGENGINQSFSSVHQALTVFKARYAIDKAATGDAERHNEALLKRMRETVDGKALDSLENEIEMSTTADLWWDRQARSLEKECIRQSFIQSPDTYRAAAAVNIPNVEMAQDEHQRIVLSIINDIKYMEELKSIRTLEEDKTGRVWKIVKDANSGEMHCLATMRDIECLDIDNVDDIRLVQDIKSGLYNYATRKGEILSNQWFPQATAFRDGTAMVADLDEKLFKIDKAFNAYDITRDELIAYGESLEKKMAKEEIPTLQRQVQESSTRSQGLHR